MPRAPPSAATWRGTSLLPEEGSKVARYLISNSIGESFSAARILISKIHLGNKTIFAFSNEFVNIFVFLQNQRESVV